MPRISEFYGIVIGMFYRDHPPPYFHAVYGEREAVIGIAPIRVLEGYLPPRALSLVFEWAAIQRCPAGKLGTREGRPPYAANPPSGVTDDSTDC